MEADFNTLKEQGNQYYHNGQFEEAIDYYNQAAESDDPSLKSICYGNIASCFAALDMIDQALESCDKALELNPVYSKVRERKIRLLLKVNKPREAKEEADKGQISEQLRAQVEREAGAQFEKDKDEMIGKLKDLGNTVLGKFGLSLDNFQVQQNEGGGYNINFSK